MILAKILIFLFLVFVIYKISKQKRTVVDERVIRCVFPILDLQKEECGKHTIVLGYKGNELCYNSKKAYEYCVSRCATELEGTLMIHVYSDGTEAYSIKSINRNSIGRCSVAE